MFENMGGEWDQKTWGEETPCGFRGCLIGHALRGKWKTATFHGGHVYVRGIMKGTIRDVTCELLGLTTSEFYELSDSDNTLEELRSIVYEK